jgi:tRNA:m4X modification enzyme
MVDSNLLKRTRSSSIPDGHVLQPSLEPTTCLNCEVKGKKKLKQGDGESLPPLPTRECQCHFFVKRKRRYCTLKARKGKCFCGEHAIFEDHASEDPRVPCPLDSNQLRF